MRLALFLGISKSFLCHLTTPKTIIMGIHVKVNGKFQLIYRFPHFSIDSLRA